MGSVRCEAAAAFSKKVILLYWMAGFILATLVAMFWLLIRNRI